MPCFKVLFESGSERNPAVNQRCAPRQNRVFIALRSRPAAREIGRISDISGGLLSGPGHKLSRGQGVLDSSAQHIKTPANFFFPLEHILAPSSRIVICSEHAAIHSATQAHAAPTRRSSLCVLVQYWNAEDFRTQYDSMRFSTRQVCARLFPSCWRLRRRFGQVTAMLSITPARACTHLLIFLHGGD
jgi:hypothetical protein